MPVAVALDFETADKYPDSACALGMTRIEGEKITESWYSLIRPPRPEVHFTEIHGLTWDMLKDQLDFASLWPSIAAFLEGAELLIAHNASFDRSVLAGCCRSSGLKVPDLPFACTVKGSRRGLMLPHHRLNDVCCYLGIPLDHHKADSDALAAAKIYLHLRTLGLTDEDMILASVKKPFSSPLHSSTQKKSALP